MSARKPILVLWRTASDSKCWASLQSSDITVFALVSFTEHIMLNTRSIYINVTCCCPSYWHGTASLSYLLCYPLKQSILQPLTSRTLEPLHLMIKPWCLDHWKETFCSMNGVSWHVHSSVWSRASLFHTPENSGHSTSLLPSYLPRPTFLSSGGCLNPRLWESRLILFPWSLQPNILRSELRCDL